MFSGSATKTSAKESFIDFLFPVLLFFCQSSFSQKLNTDPITSSHTSQVKNTAGQWLVQRFKCFAERHGHNTYSITLCGDVPDNERPMKVYFKKEPGHVFLVLTMEDTVCHFEPRSQVFGFYPQRPVSSVIFKNVRCKMMDNGNRIYDVKIEKDLSASEFDLVLENAVVFAQKKYNLNRYNCYDYALNVFNCFSGIEKIPVNRVRFPFIAGKGGSPVCLFRDLRKLYEEGSWWAPYIDFGSFKAPVSFKNKDSLFIQ